MCLHLSSAESWCMYSEHLAWLGGIRIPACSHLGIDLSLRQDLEPLMIATYLPAISGALMVYVLCVSKATTAGINSMREVRWLRADEYSMNALNTGTGSIDSTLQHTAQHSMALQVTERQSTLQVAHQVCFYAGAATHSLCPTVGMVSPVWHHQCIVLLKIWAMMPCRGSTM